MTLEQMLKQLETYTGQVATLETERDAKTYKTITDDVRKHSVFQVRFGVKYANQKAVAEKHKSGEVQKTGLWNGWVEKGRVAIQNVKTGKVLLRAAPSRNTHSIHKAEWLLNGKPVKQSAVSHMLTAAETKEKPEQDWVYIDPKNLVSLNGEPFRLDS